MLVATLHRNEQKYFGDLVKEAEAVKNVLDEAVAHPEELERIIESDVDLAEWVKLLGSIDDAVRLIKNVRDRLMCVLNRYKPHPVPSEVRMSDKKDRKKSQERSNKWWMHA
jgi:hypothetical protein